MSPSPWSLLLAVMVGGLLQPLPAIAAKPSVRIPASENEVLYRSDREWNREDATSTSALRARWREDPESVERAVPLARRYLEMGRRTGDLRYTGYARAVLEPWWHAVQVPGSVALLRARIRARAHDFIAAARELEDLISRDQGAERALLDLAMIRLAQGDLAGAAAACHRYRRFDRGLMGVTCSAVVEGRGGNARRAFSRIARALARSGTLAPTSRAFALGELADLAWRLGKPQRACALYEQAMSVAGDDHALLMRFADCLHDLGQFDRVMALLDGFQDRDALALRYAIAAQRAGLAVDARRLAERLRLARARGAPAPGLEARFALDLAGKPEQALGPALTHFDQERNPDSARLVVRAARAAGRETPQRVLDWIRETRLEDARIDFKGAPRHESA